MKILYLSIIGLAIVTVGIVLIFLFQSHSSSIKQTEISPLDPEMRPRLFLIPQHSVGKIVVLYIPEYSLTEYHLDTSFFDGKTGNAVSPSIIRAMVSPNIAPGGEWTYATYTITSNDTNGIYWLNLSYCNSIPIVVGLETSQINGSDLYNVDNCIDPHYLPIVNISFINVEGMVPER